MTRTLNCVTNGLFVGTAARYNDDLFIVIGMCSLGRLFLTIAYVFRALQQSHSSFVRALVPRSPASPDWLPRLVAHSPDSMQAFFLPVFSLLTSVPSSLVPLGRTNLSSWQHRHSTVPTYTFTLVSLIWRADNYTCNNCPLF
ncbi:hypothetical protein F5148DRAFT_477027 [Russula earlei]|uniref:Uncharacterized protein n=1 Tax=Russula earlei TaxID=71964 RepID=A0ACC0TY91_9AGAM|nr:hypothetical protein F5148DRAFT_477027 [Russula earlei]